MNYSARKSYPRLRSFRQQSPPLENLKVSREPRPPAVIPAKAGIQESRNPGIQESSELYPSSGRNDDVQRCLRGHRPCDDMDANDQSMAFYEPTIPFKEYRIRAGQFSLNCREAGEGLPVVFLETMRWGNRDFYDVLGQRFHLFILEFESAHVDDMRC